MRKGHSNRNISLALFALVALILAASWQARAQRPEAVGAISGMVVDMQGRPVADASVTIQTSDGLHPHATRTNRSGHFEFVRFAIGQYDLRAYSKGVFSEWSRRIVIRSKKTTEITLRLAAK